MLVSLVHFETVLGGNGFLTQVAFEALFMDIDHVFHVAVLFLPFYDITNTVGDYPGCLHGTCAPSGSSWT